uniref:L27-1 domain-containing protein n=1 Tax=Amphiprion percula TaxID=161767 RepID=A0A3P8T2A1_AMPPE
MLYLDAQRALELLQQYRTKQAIVEEDLQLQQSLDRVINVFQSQLFSALLGKKTCLGQFFFFFFIR